MLIVLKDDGDGYGYGKCNDREWEVVNRQRLRKRSGTGDGGGHSYGSEPWQVVANEPYEGYGLGYDDVVSTADNGLGPWRCNIGLSLIPLAVSAGITSNEMSIVSRVIVS